MVQMDSNSDITANLRKHMTEKGRKFEIRKNQVFQSSDHREMLTFIESGYVKRYSITNNGTHSVQSIYGPGYIFPLTWMYKVIFNQLLYTGRETYHYETLTPAVVYGIDTETLKTLFDDNTDIYKDFLQVAGRRMHSNIHNLENLSLLSTEKRLAHEIAHLAETYGQPVKNGIQIDVPLRQQDYASILDVARETISVSMKSLRDKNLIITDKKIIVPNMERLLDEAYS